LFSTHLYVLTKSLKYVWRYGDCAKCKKQNMYIRIPYFINKLYHTVKSPSVTEIYVVFAYELC